MNNKANPQPKKNPGGFSVVENKIRVQNANGQSSVLIEDISSISYKELSTPDMSVFMWGFAVVFGGMFIGIFLESGTISFLGFFAGLGMMVKAHIDKIKWDEVIIETRGGMLLNYSVDFGKGSSEVEKIETARRG